MSWLVTQFKKEQWSPYVAGVVLGLTGIVAVALGNSLLGASGVFENLGGMLVRAVTGPSFDSSPTFAYWNKIMRVMPPEITFGVILAVGIFFGGMLGAWSSGTLKLRWNDDPLWNRVIGPERWKRWAIAFGGAILLEYAAGIAGGCTSGLAISGGMLLAPAAFLFIAGMFASGIVTALVVYRGRY